LRRHALLLPLLFACRVPEKPGADGVLPGPGSGDGGGGGGGGGGGELPPPTSGSDGFVFKGPMAPGSTVTFQPVDADLMPAGDPATLEVGAWDGSYAGELPLEGLVEVIAEGSAYNEAAGAWSEAEPLRLRAWAVLDGEVSVQVNVLTDLTHDRVAAKLRSGLPLDAAQAEAEAELHAALGWSRRGEVESAGTALVPFGDTYDQSWLFALSSILAQAGRDRGRGDGDDPAADMLGLDAVLTELREAFAADGRLPEDGLAALAAAELAMDPDLALLGLEALLEDNGLSLPLPDLHEALDSDRDRVVNGDDNCRYVANEDQATLPDGYPYGAACDTRLSSLSHTEGWGCGVLAGTGELRCWAVRGGETGGTPPRPDVYPAADGAPWGDRPYFTGAYVEVALGFSGGVGPEDTTGLVLCAARAGGGVDCWDGANPDELLQTDDTLTHLRASGAAVCGLDAEASAICYDRATASRWSLPGPFSAVDAREDGNVCTIRARDGQVLCPDATGKPSSDGMPVGKMAALAVNDADGLVYGCAIASEDGSLSCFGDLPLSPPAGTGFTSVAVSPTLICAAGPGVPVSCARQEERCPEAGAAPAEGAGLSAAGCVACAVDGLGLGDCWPRAWDAARAG